ncbi:MAG: HAD-IA family hydrolase [Chloroflexi bacterium]|nr:HAD-IA family hydrolase [Chloroflexota bacterium]MBU1751901.1 HAD-IA family hydrolase [Chloroflexota bacterium]
MRYDTVFLDMGFTLVDIAPSMEAIMARAIHDLTGQDVPLSALEEAMRHVWSGVLDDEPMIWPEPSEEADRLWMQDIDRHILARVGVTQQIDAICDHVYNLFSQADAYRLYDDTRPALAALRARGYRLGIISNWGWHLPAICADLGLDQHFDAVLASARVGFEKPHPSFFHHALAVTNTHPARAVHVGDSLRADVRGAHGAGLDAVLLVRDGRPVPEDAGCPVIHTLLDLPAVLERDA